MSRICVKNLPKHATEERLRDFFSKKGEVTDAKLMRTKDGKSRQFGFVGYRTEEEADQAVKYFDKSYMDTSRIYCEIARKVGDPDIPRAWSRYSAKKEENSVQKETEQPNLKGKKNIIRKDNENEDLLLQEFLQVMQPRAKSKLWADDAGAVPTGQMGAAKDKKTKKDAVSAKLDETETSDSIDTHSNEDAKLVDKNEVISDMDYFKSRVKTEWSDSESSAGEDNSNGSSDDDDGSLMKNSNSQLKKGGPRGHENDINVQPSNVDHDEASPEDSNHEMNNLDDPSSALGDDVNAVSETSRLFVRNLPYTATEEDLEEHFRKFENEANKDIRVHLVVDKDTNRSKGFAFVHYNSPKSASSALEKVDNSIFQGRLLHVLPAKQQHPSKKQETNTLTVKQRREEAKKASEANGNTQSQNSLFMRFDTVLENIARKKGVSKSDILDRYADGPALRMSLAETLVVADTKKSLAKAGVNVASLEKSANDRSSGEKRSNHVILVKNLPYATMEAELAKMFGKFGSLDKIILPETKILALVVFLEPANARTAFKGLTHKRYKDAPLYLEWAPDDILNLDPTTVVADVAIKDEFNGEHRKTLEQHMEGVANEDIDHDRVESRSLYVKNLNFKTTDESLKEHFTKRIKDGKIVNAMVKKHLKNGKQVSAGFGFIQFDSVDTAVKVSKDLQGTVLDGMALMLQICHAKKDEKVLKKSEKDRSSTKLIARNVAFQATEKELRQLFSPFGQIKSLRLPMKPGGHRGFAFVEFVTKQEAANALEALANTHLYGRHLVLERAKEGESLEELRARTAAQFSDGVTSTNFSKKRKHMIAFDEEQ